MIDGLKPYPEYRPSDHPWRGEVPAHWTEKRAKYFFREVDERSTTGEEELLSVSHKTGVTPPKAHVTMFKAESNVGHKICRPDDMVINTMWAFMAALGVSREVGLVSPSYGVYRSIRSGELHPEYVDRLLRIEDYKSEYLCRSTGIRSSRLRLYPDQFLRIPILCPSAEEQAAIVRFLDHVDRRVRRYIRAKRQLIALLNEQKQAIIHRAVTCGLDPNVKLKPSGIEWLGNVPEHWEVSRLKFEADKIVDCLHATPDYVDDGEFPANRTADVVPGRVLLDNARRIGQDEFARWTQRLEPKEGDILYSREGERYGIAACVPAATRLCISQRMMVFRIDENHNSQFVMWLLNSRQVFAQADQDTLGATAPHVNVSTIRNFALTLPPRDEQDAIIDYIQSSICHEGPISRMAQDSIKKVTDFRTRLIADVVTGRRDVRASAERLQNADDSIGDDLVEEEIDAELEELEVEA